MREVGVLFLCLGVAGCGHGRQGETLRIEAHCTFDPARVPAGRPVAVTYSWRVDPRAQRIRSDADAFVHFVEEGTLLFTDDHEPTPSPKDWIPGQIYGYTRIVFVPKTLAPGEIEARVGLWSREGRRRFALLGLDRGLNEYAAGRLEVLRRPEGNELIYGAGWYSPETPAADPFTEKRWMGREGWAWFRGRKKDVTVFLDAEALALPRPTVLGVSVRRTGVNRTLEGSGRFTERIHFRADDLGEHRWLELRLEVSQTFVPKSLGLNADVRELGLCVHNLYVTETESLPAFLREGALESGPLPDEMPQ
jgi:hypothetical protein